jgi:acetylornithine deacetylase
MQAVRDILSTLVGIPSVTSMSNGPLLDAVEALLQPHGWVTQRLPYVASDGIEKANLLAVPRRFQERLPEVEMLFACHTDTVPYRGEWAGATRLEERGGALHGCGSCDVKGAMAGLLAAAQQVRADELQIPIAYAFTAEEEIGCIGVTKLITSGAVRPRRVIVCEPTSLRPATAGKGYGLAEVRVRGREAHSAFPQRGVSAIQIAARLMVALERWLSSGELPTDTRFSPPCTTFNIGVIEGGSAKNIVAGKCRFLVEWRPLPSEDPRHGGEIVRRLAAEIAADAPQCYIEVEVLRADRGFANAVDAPMGAALSALLSKPETGISFGSEATRFAAIAEEAVVIGPGDMETAHSERECVPLHELEAWTETVRQMLICGPVAWSVPGRTSV